MQKTEDFPRLDTVKQLLFNKFRWHSRSIFDSAKHLICCMLFSGTELKMCKHLLN